MTLRLFDLHWMAFYLCCGISLSVFLAMMVALFRRCGAMKMLNTSARSFGREMFWAIIPFVILLALVAPTVTKLVAHA